MRTALLLSMVAVNFINVTPSFAQTAFGPTYPYPQGYEELGPSGPAARQFSSFDYGVARTRKHASPSSIEPTQAG
jgi:hypothetical protein